MNETYVEICGLFLMTERSFQLFWISAIVGGLVINLCGWWCE